MTVETVLYCCLVTGWVARLGFWPQLVLHFVCNSQKVKVKLQHFILLFFDFHKNQLTLRLLLLQSNITASMSWLGSVDVIMWQTCLVQVLQGSQSDRLGFAAKVLDSWTIARPMKCRAMKWHAMNCRRTGKWRPVAVRWDKESLIIAGR